MGTTLPPKGRDPFSEGSFCYSDPGVVGVQSALWMILRLKSQPDGGWEEVLPGGEAVGGEELARLRWPHYTCRSSQDPDATAPATQVLSRWLPLHLTFLSNLWRLNSGLKVAEAFRRQAVQPLVPQTNRSTSPGHFHVVEN